jgi:hypothetical protein
MPTEDRPYRISDPHAIELCDTLVRIYADHMVELAAIDPDFDAAFATAWKAATDALLRHPSYALTLDLLAVHSAALNETMARGSKAISALRYYAQQAFGANGIFRSFRWDRNQVLRKRPTEYAVYLRKMHRTATVHLAALQAKGLTAAHMQELVDAADAILAAELDQEAYKDEIIHLTYQRTQLSRAMWAYAQKVNAAAEVAFASEPVKRALFNLE